MLCMYARPRNLKWKALLKIRNPPRPLGCLSRVFRIHDRYGRVDEGGVGCLRDTFRGGNGAVGSVTNDTRVRENPA